MTADNGSATVYVEESHALPLVSLALAFRSGASRDPAGKDGLMRVVVRMLRRGCKGLSAHAIEDRLDALGAEFSADVSTSIVTLHVDVIARSLDPLVDLLSEILAEPAFDEVELGRLLRETEGEIIEARDNDRALATRQLRRVLFEGHPYGRRVSGQIGTLKTITRDDVANHYRRHFVRNNVVIAFSGDVTVHHAKTLSDRLLQGLPAGSKVGNDIPNPVAKKGRRLVFVDKPQRTQTQILIGSIGSHPRDVDHVPLIVATTVFGGTFTSRLMREVRSKRGWSYGAYARLGYDQEREAFTVWTFPAAKDAAACIALELDLLRRFREKGLSARELSFAKRYLVRSHAFDIDTSEKRVHARLDVDLLGLPSDYHVAYVKHVKDVTLEGANASVLQRMPEDDLVIAVVGTHAEIGNAIVDAVGGLSEVVVTPYNAE